MSDAQPHEMFVGLILSLQASTWVHLGKVANPGSGKVERNLPAAKETIDLLGMLEQKTKGNLVQEEEELLRDLLTNLRLNYVEEARREKAEKDTSSPEQTAADASPQAEAEPPAQEGASEEPAD